MTILSTPVPAVRPRLDAAPYQNWQAAMKDAVRDPYELCRLLDLPGGLARAATKAERAFPLFVPRGYVARMEPGNPDDPLLRQVLPRDEELAEVDGFGADPVGDEAACRRPGLLQKYRGRVLLVATGVCAVHCRYCFRREFSYDDAPTSVEAWEPAFAEIASDATIHEVILSGGDPLTLVDGTLAQLVQRLSDIPHLQRLRVHTRLPIMIPERVTERLLQVLSASRLAAIVVLHANHARELDDQVADALAKLSHAGIVLLNQAVLLRGVNDSADAQAALCERLVQLRVIPYYLHQLDRVRGAAHYEVHPETGRQIIRQLRATLPGYAVPRYVREIPGEPGKSPLI